jgi:hypothetical protein
MKLKIVDKTKIFVPKRESSLRVLSYEVGITTTELIKLGTGSLFANVDLR